MLEAFIIYLYFIIGTFLNVLVPTTLTITSIYFVFLFFSGIFSEFGEATTTYTKETTSEAVIFNSLKVWWKTSACAFLGVLFLYSIYPSKDDLKYIIGGAIVWNGVNNARDIKGINELPENLIGAANFFLKEISSGEIDTNAIVNKTKEIGKDVIDKSLESAIQEVPQDK